MKTTVSIAGASGYTGAELLTLLLRHPNVEVAHVYAHTSAGKKIAADRPALAKVTDLSYEPLDAAGNDDSEVVFVSLPHGESQKIIPQFIGKKRVIDLGGDFRLRSADLYNRYYRSEHTAQELIGHAVYGMPELNREEIKGSAFVANPGCYPTSAILALAPLAAARLLPSHVGIVSLSGVSGAGKSPSPATHFPEANESVSAYKVGAHQHTPEIEQALTILAGSDITATFIPHLLPITRGIHTTIVLPALHNYTFTDVHAMYEKYYAAAPFVRLLPQPPRIKDAAYTNFCDVHIAHDAHAGTLVILSAIDNLVKGAGGQAIQNMNIMLGFPETTGLL